MIPALIAIELLTLVAVLALFLRKPPAPVQDPRQAAVPDQLAAIERNLRADLAGEALSTRAANEQAAASLRTEVLHSVASLGSALTAGLETFRADNKTSAETLRNAVQQTLDTLDQRLTAFASESSRAQLEAQSTLHGKLAELAVGNATQQESLRKTVQERLDALAASNEAKLEKMRETVDEKLQKTLETRLTASFGQVTTHLGEVQRGLGEMKELATGVGDLKKVLSNVSRRGGVGQLLVEQQLEQKFSPEQYAKQVNLKPSTRECVDFVIKFPNGDPGSFVLLPIDSKFPTADRERLEQAQEAGDPDGISFARKAFERAIRTQAKSIAEKYIAPPITFPIAIMALPTESLYAEVARCPGLQEEIEQQFGVTIAGPSNFMMLVTTFQFALQTLAIQKKGDEVWRILAKAKAEFNTYGTLMDKVGNQVGSVQKTLRKIKGKTTTINRALKGVSTPDALPPAAPAVLAFEDYAGVAPLLAASTADDDDDTIALSSNE